MKVYQTNEIKNIALLGNDGSGKTTLTESLLFESGIIKRRGRITAKNTVSDYFPVEQEYGYSVFSTVYHVEWNGKKLNIIDCPGSDDFVGAAITALNVTDTAILLLNGQYGPEVGTQNHFRYTEKLGKPVIFLVNQLDNEKCDYDNVLEQLRSIYGFLKIAFTSVNLNLSSLHFCFSPPSTSINSNWKTILISFPSLLAY